MLHSARQTIRAGIAILESFPRAGRHIEHLPGEFREWPIRFGAARYILLYRVKVEVEVDDRLTIAALRHMREDGFPDFDGSGVRANYANPPPPRPLARNPVDRPPRREFGECCLARYQIR